MKTLAAGIFLFFISLGLGAQERANAPYPVRPRFNLDVEFSIPSGEFGRQFGYGFGGSGGLDIPVTRSFYITGSTGVMSFYQGGKSTPVDTRSYVPAKAGAKFYFNRSVFAQMELGPGFGIQQGAGTVFIMTPGVGASWHLTEKAAINTGFRFESWSRESGNISLWSFKVGYQF